MAKGNSNPNKTRDIEFKMSISSEDIDEIDQQIKNIKIDSNRSDESNIRKTKYDK